LLRIWRNVSTDDQTVNAPIQKSVMRWKIETKKLPRESLNPVMDRSIFNILSALAFCCSMVFFRSIGRNLANFRGSVPCGLHRAQDLRLPTGRRGAPLIAHIICKWLDGLHPRHQSSDLTGSISARRPALRPP